MKIINKIPTHLLYIFLTYILGIMSFSLFRLILFFTQCDQLDNIPEAERWIVMLKSFIMGVRFDTVVSGYILIVPLVMLSITSFFKTFQKLQYKIIFGYLSITYTLSFLICAIDIPYFNHFFARFSAVAFNWTDDSSFIVNMVFQEFKFWGISIPFVIISALFIWSLHKIVTMLVKKDENTAKKNSYLIAIVMSVLTILLTLIGIRGRLESKSPIRVGTAFFSQYTFPNQLGLNPVFTLIRSSLNSMKKENQKIHFMDEKQAFENVRKYLKIKNPITDISPIARKIQGDSIQKKANVIIVIMESMSAAKVGAMGAPGALTANLDTIARNGLLFKNIYTAGMHTFNGTFSTLFSFPALKQRHPMKAVTMLKYAGISTILKKAGYRTVYFTTHDSQFDNAGGFLTANDFDKIVSQKDYPSNKVNSALGVPDDYLFEYSIPVLNELHNTGQPFLAALLTASDHGPYIIPEYFKPKSEEIKKQIVEYADWSIAKFLKLASKEKWFDNTLFVFIADHGAPIDVKYDIPLNYHHSPLIMYSPKLIDSAESFDCIGGQIDVFPTIMGRLGMPYLNNTFGIDLLRETRDYIYFCADDKIGILDKDFYLIIREDGHKSLYRHSEGDTKDLARKYPDKAREMENYVKSMMQAGQSLVDNNRAKIE